MKPTVFSPCSAPPSISTDIGTLTTDQWREMMVSAMSAIMERKLSAPAVRAAWQVLAWSYGMERQETGRLTVRDLARRTGLTISRAHGALKELRACQIIAKNSDGDGWRYVPEVPGLHMWLATWRLVDPADRLLAKRMDAVQRRRVGEIDFWPEDTPSLDKAMMEAEADRRGADLRSEIGNKARSAEEVGETVGGGEKYLSAGVRVARTDPPEPASKSFSSPRSTERPLTLTLKGQSVLPKRTNPLPIGAPESGGEAFMEGDDLAADGISIEEDVLIARLGKLLGKDGDWGMKEKGSKWRLFIRGTKDALDDPASATAIRDAINETFERQRDPRKKPIRNLFGFVWSLAMSKCNWAGFLWTGSQWERCKSFNKWEHDNAAGKKPARKQAVSK